MAEESARIFDMQKYRRGTGSTDDVRSSVRPVVTQSDGGSGQSAPEWASPPSAREAQIDDLYNTSDAASTALIVRARTLLAQASGLAKESHQALISGDKICSDQSMMLLQAALVELFCCREVSDGLKMFTVALYHGIQNLRGVPLNLDQVYAVCKGLEKLHSDIFLTFDEGLVLVEPLVNAELVIDPPEAEILADVLVDQLPA